jgi:NIMA (never in mitosis gene a)-related kinase
MFRILNLTSPEIWKKESYDSKSDIWALGCVLYEMISLFTPF